MLCLRCGASPPAGSKYCPQCNALLLQAAPQEPRAGLSLEEGREYPVPQERFLTHNLNVLHDLLYHNLEEVPGYLSELRGLLEEFAGQAVPQLLELLLVEEQADPEGSFVPEVRYLMVRGVDLFREGLDRLEGALSPLDEAEAESAFETLSQGNDHLCGGLLKVEERQQELLRRVERAP
ncbi:MAG: hypothetical protein AMXMBFR33_36920 [Candidatus Xenobia bacterium]